MLIRWPNVICMTKAPAGLFSQCGGSAHMFTAVCLISQLILGDTSVPGRARWRLKSKQIRLVEFVEPQLLPNLIGELSLLLWWMLNCPLAI